MADDYRRLLTVPKGSFFLHGVRGVGKSTWARTTFPDAHMVDLLDEFRHQELAANPGLFALELASVPRGKTVVIDEVQRVPPILNEVHRAIEATKRRFVLLGSSARKLKTAGTNLLAGRASLQTMFPLTPSELGLHFALERTLRFGSIPLVWQSEDPATALQAYAQLYLREEIRGEALVRNLPGFLRFLPVAAVCHGQVVNVSGLARDSATARTTVEGYLSILEDTLVAAMLPAFEARLRVRERRHPKLYWVDSGLVRAIKRQFGPVTVEERGALLEGWVFMLLRAHNQGLALFEDLAYWAPLQAGQTEVDFLLRRGSEYVALEVKARPRFAADQLSGLRAIGDLPKVVRRVLVYLGERSLRTDDGIDVWPLRAFLHALEAGTLWP
jgi:predicted AAA+ superfamily ATPase